MDGSATPSVDRLDAARGIVCGLGISCGFWMSLVLYLTLGGAAGDNGLRGPVREASVVLQNNPTNQEPVR